MTVRCIAAASVPVQAWRNGGGRTRELLRIDAPGAGTDDWLLRISLADIDADGAFSAFEGIARWFAVVSGHGVRLQWPSRRLADLDLHVGDAPLHFDGGDAPFCRLLDGPTRDLNVMARRIGATVELGRAHPGAPWRWQGPGRGVFTLRACTLHREGHDALPLAPQTLAWSAPETRDEMAAWRLSEAFDPAAGTSPLAFWIGFDETPAP